MGYPHVRRAGEVGTCPKCSIRRMDGERFRSRVAWRAWRDQSVDKVGMCLFLIEVGRWETEWELEKPTGEWAWARMLDASGEFKPSDRPTCFAYTKDRIAVAYPQMGVKVWLWVNGKFLRPGVPNP